MLAISSAVALGWAPPRFASSAPCSCARAPAPRAVFSGIVEEMGRIRRAEAKENVQLWDGSVGSGFELEVEASEVLGGAYIGCSIAVNGVCLTVTEYDEQSFTVGLAPETLRRTNLPKLTAGSRVNLERALAADGRNSGHMVQGHIDDVGVIEEMRLDGDALWVTVRPPPNLMPYIVPKGFIAVDGTSLTVCNAEPADGKFDFMLVAHTQQCIILPKKQVGDTVNLEVDVTAKYVERSMSSMTQRIEDLERRLAAAKL